MFPDSGVRASARTKSECRQDNFRWADYTACMPEQIPYQLITSQSQLEAFCDRSRNTTYVGFDTEFVSENRYRPELCLIQVATDDEIVLIDTLSISDADVFWEWLVTGDHVTVVHAAREEFLFCFRASGRQPKHLFDVQLAAAFVGLDYPASYGNLVAQLLGEYVAKGETRTDWKRRPLTERQLQYALFDVVHLQDLYQVISQRLDELNRTSWYTDEVDFWMEELAKQETEPQWQRVSGITSLSPRELAIVRELWICRDRYAAEKNRAPKRVLPDDLIVELARRGSSSPSSMKAIRGFEGRVHRGIVKSLTEAIDRANSLTKGELPKRLQRSKTVNLGLLGQFLSTALTVVCREQQISPAIVGTASDVRAMAAWRLGMIKLDEPPSLVQGWRAEIVGQLIDQVLNGHIAIRVDDPKSDRPLMIEFLNGDSGKRGVERSSGNEGGRHRGKRKK